MKLAKIITSTVVLLGLTLLSFMTFIVHPLQTKALDNLPNVTLTNTELRVLHSDRM